MRSPAPPRRPSAHERAWELVRRIPRGRVATYGQIAALAGLSGARQAGYALAALPEQSPVPWHRVINARGEISPRGEPGAAEWQRHRLEEEGVRFDPRGRVDLARYLWEPDAAVRVRPAGARRSGRGRIVR